MKTAAALADELLAVRCQLGEPGAMDALVERWHATLWHYVRRMSVDDDSAAETMQDTWLRIIRGMPSLRDTSRIRAWVFGVARRALMDRLRAQYAEAVEVELKLDDFETTDETTEEPFDADIIRNGLASLRARSREVLLLFYLQDLSLAQIADVLSVPVGTVKSRLFAARTELRALLNNGERLS